MDMIWPLGLIVQGLTSADDDEIRHCLITLQKTHAGTGFMHEAFNKDDPKKFTRSWFAWANTIFGELVLKTFHQRPRLLD
jgi:meiotically up-regulated gene 157 (Mug157) protein